MEDHGGSDFPERTQVAGLHERLDGSGLLACTRQLGAANLAGETTVDVLPLCSVVLFRRLWLVFSLYGFCWSLLNNK